MLSLFYLQLKYQKEEKTKRLKSEHTSGYTIVVI